MRPNHNPANHLRIVMVGECDGIGTKNRRPQDVVLDRNAEDLNPLFGLDRAGDAVKVGSESRGVQMAHQDFGIAR